MQSSPEEDGVAMVAEGGPSTRFENIPHLQHTSSYFLQYECPQDPEVFSVPPSPSLEAKVCVPTIECLGTRLSFVRPQLGLYALNFAQQIFPPTTNASSQLVTLTASILSAYLCCSLLLVRTNTFILNLRAAFACCRRDCPRSRERGSHIRFGMCYFRTVLAKWVMQWGVIW